MMINGSMYRNMVISGANAIENAKEKINSLNVFPVPDGDTGQNMSMTMCAGREAMKIFEGTLTQCADKVANALLRDARGNSGVILSLFFRGFAKELKGKNDCDALSLARALKGGVDAAYRSVMNPTEGTILTVMRESAEYALSAAAEYEGTIADFWRAVTDVAVTVLKRTPEMLPVLKQANVVDAGGQGFVTILEGMYAALIGTPVEQRADSSASAPADQADFSEFNTEDITFAYCTECIVDKDKAYQGEGHVDEFRSFILNIGDSAVFVDDEELIKIHVHTNEPGRVLTEALRYGMLATVKIENMRRQHSEMASGVANAESTEVISEPAVMVDKPYAFVSVVAGDGFESVFRDLGVDGLVAGGQTMNPSTGDIVHAIEQTTGETVFVLPNNKNIYMAAKQAEDMVEGRRVIVLQTVSVPQGISAMIAFDGDATPEENEAAMMEAVGNVRTGSLTFAARDSVFDGEEIREGQILGLVENKVKHVCDTQEDALLALADHFRDASYITLFYGEGIAEEDAQKMADILGKELGDGKDIMLVYGGQPVYYYIIYAE